MKSFVKEWKQQMVDSNSMTVEEMEAQNFESAEGAEHWELVNVDHESSRSTERLKVPGGWIYLVSQFFRKEIDDDEMIVKQVSTFVPQH